VWRLSCLKDVDSHAGGSLAAGRVTLARQVLGNWPDKERYPGPANMGAVQWVSASLTYNL
jgi:hypothetical protein